MRAGRRVEHVGMGAARRTLEAGQVCQVVEQLGQVHLCRWLSMRAGGADDTTPVGFVALRAAERAPNRSHRPDRVRGSGARSWFAATMVLVCGDDPAGRCDSPGEGGRTRLASAAGDGGGGEPAAVSRAEPLPSGVGVRPRVTRQSPKGNNVLAFSQEYPVLGNLRRDRLKQEARPQPAQKLLQVSKAVLRIGIIC